MFIGYARVSTVEQSLDLQLRALAEAKCDKIFTDHGMTGTNIDRDGYREAMSTLEEGDTLVV